MIVGVIGGAGVAATNKLCELIETRLTQEGAFRDAHHPEMIVYQATKAPSRSMFLEGRGESFVDDYIAVAQKLKSAGAETLCMCCNTAHYAIDEIEKTAQVPFINLIKEVVLEARQSGKTRVGLVASDGCLLGRVYERYFGEIFPEVQLIYPTPEIQKLVTKGICNVKNTCRFLPASHPDRPAHIFSQVHDALIRQGAELVIMGCTDIRVDYAPTTDTIDSLEILANVIYKLSK